MPEDTAVKEPQTYTQEQLAEAIAEANAGLEANRNEVLADLRKTKETLKQFDGVDAAKHREMQKRLAELEQEAKADKAGIQSGELEKIRADVRHQIESEYEPYKSKASELAEKVRVLELDNVVKGLMGKSGVRADRINALFKLAGDRFGLTDDGQPMLIDEMGKDVSKYISEELEKEYPEFYQSSGSSGSSGAKSVSSGHGRVKVIDPSDGQAILDNLQDIADGKVTFVE